MAAALHLNRSQRVAICGKSSEVSSTARRPSEAEQIAFTPTTSGYHCDDDGSLGGAWDRDDRWRRRPLALGRGSAAVALAPLLLA
jgi:hypothetical protein